MPPNYFTVQESVQGKNRPLRRGEPPRQGMPICPPSQAKIIRPHVRDGHGALKSNAPPAISRGARFLAYLWGWFNKHVLAARRFVQETRDKCKAIAAATHGRSPSTSAIGSENESREHSRKWGAGAQPLLAEGTFLCIHCLKFIAQVRCKDMDLVCGVIPLE